MKTPNLFGGRTMVFIGVAFFLLAGYAAWRGLITEGDDEKKVEGRGRSDFEGSFRTTNRIKNSSNRFSPADADAWFAEVVARHPEMEPEWKSVPDEKNGFLQLLKFSERYDPGGEGGLGSEAFGFPEALTRILTEEDAWDAVAVAALLRDQQDFLEEITRIALLPERSSAGISPSRQMQMDSSLFKRGVDLLLADARLAAESGDRERAFKRGFWPYTMTLFSKILRWGRCSFLNIGSALFSVNHIEG